MIKGEVLQEGDIFQQPALAQTLQAVADNGAGAFYKGAIAKVDRRLLRD